MPGQSRLNMFDNCYGHKRIAQAKFIGLFIAVLSMAVCQGILAELLKGDGLYTEIFWQLFGSAAIPSFLTALAPIGIGPPDPPDATSLLSFENSALRRYILKLTYRISTFNGQAHPIT